MGRHEQWQVSGNAPETYERYMVPTLFTQWATDLVALRSYTDDTGVAVPTEAHVAIAHT